jgi:RNA polymerase sigma-70 factor (ECF subfamily)
MAPRRTSIQTWKSQRDKTLEARRAARPRLAEERRLADRARAGDPAALRQLIERVAGPVYRYGRRFCGNAEDAQDVMQDALVALVRSLPSYRGDAALSSWAYTVARNACSRLRRRRVGEPDRIESLHGEEAGAAARRVAAATPGPEHELERRELAAALDQALAELPPAQREVVLLRDVEGLTAPEVGGILGLTEEAVKSRLHRGRLALRRSLAVHRGEPDPAAGAHRPGCPDAARMLSRYLEGELGPDVCERLSAHVDACEACRESCAALRSAITLCSRQGVAALPREARRAMRAALQELDGAAR